MENEYIHRLSESEGKADADLSRIRRTVAEEFQGKLFDYVNNDYNLAKTFVLKEKIKALQDKKGWMLNEPREQNKKSLADLDNRIEMLSEVVFDFWNPLFQNQHFNKKSI